jgi:thiamine-monophosphate kinase
MLLVSDLGEHALLERIRSRVPPPPPWVLVGIGDDAAVVEPARGSVDVLTTDALIEGVHFDRRFSSAADVGYKALAVNLSDLAAMGAAPRTALLSLGLPPALSVADLDALMDGLLELAALESVALAGGNIARSPGPLWLSLTASGAVRRRRVLPRGGGRAGDELFVSGTIGGAAAGLEALQAGAAEGAALEDCAARHRRPVPRVRLGRLIAGNRVASACMDLSDGLADAVRQVAAASGLGAIVEAAAIPLHEGARDWFGRGGRDPVDAALAAGEDYELLFAVASRRRSRLATVRRQARGLALTRIGILTADPAVRLRKADGDRDLPAGYQHFQSR